MFVITPVSHFAFLIGAGASLSLTDLADNHVSFAQSPLSVRITTASNEATVAKVFGESHADLLVWGKVVGTGPKAQLPLNLVQGETPLVFELPPLSWNDTLAVFDVLVETLPAVSGSEPASPQRELAALPTVRSLLPSVGNQGEQWRKGPRYSALQRDWARIQNDLSIALQSPLVVSSRPDALKESVDAVKGALQVVTRDANPQIWSTYEDTLCTGLSKLGWQTHDAQLLSEGVAACHAALAERTPAIDPQRWATTQMNLGDALLAQAQQESSPRGFTEALAAYRRALQVRTQAKWPNEHAKLERRSGHAQALLAIAQSQLPCAGLKTSLEALSLLNNRAEAFEAAQTRGEISDVMSKTTAQLRLRCGNISTAEWVVLEP